MGTTIEAFEDAGNLQFKEYYMKEFYKQLNKSENSRMTGVRKVMPHHQAIKQENLCQIH